MSGICNVGKPPHALVGIFVTASLCDIYYSLQLCLSIIVLSCYIMHPYEILERCSRPYEDWRSKPYYRDHEGSTYD